MRIILVEDDVHQAKEMEIALGRSIADLRVELIRSEHEFRDRLSDIAEDPPDIVLLDVMLPWTRPSPNMPTAPPDVRENLHEGGFRCARLLHESSPTIPAIICSVLDESDVHEMIRLLPANAVYVRKDAHADALIATILALTGRTPAF